MENVLLIEMSSEDDLLTPSSSQKFGIYNGSTLEVEKIEKMEKNLEEVPHLSDSPEQNQKVSDRYNLRKSLAWDSAFLTGEGILNPEELATMNKTHSKAGITLPAIQELGKSSESVSTLDSDNWQLEHLEVDLFANVRDSVQRSLGSSSHTKNMVHHEKIKEQKKPDGPNARTLKKIDDPPTIKLEPPNAMRRHDVTRQCLEHTSKGDLIRMNMPSQGNVESKPLLRLPKVSSKTHLLPASAPGKKTSIEIKDIKGATTKQQAIATFNKPNGVRGVPLTKPTSASQIGLVLTPTLGSSSSSLTGSSKSRSISSVANVGKRSANRISSYSSSNTGKTSVNTSINGSKVENHHRDLTMSSSILSKISPTSSIDSAVSEFSSSTSISTKLGKALEDSNPLSSSSSVAFSSTLDLFQNSGSLSQSFIDDRTKSNVNGECGSRLARPSGLRAPRPTVGFFDKEKTLVRGLNKAPKASMQNNLMKNSSFNYAGATNKVKSIYLPTVRENVIPFALSKQASKSAKVTQIENQQKLCLKVNKISAVTVAQDCKINFKNEQVPADEVEKVQSCNSSKKEPNLLHPHVFAGENETERFDEHKTHYQSHDQQENVKNGQKAADGETEKENVCPDLKTKETSKMQKMEGVIGGEDVLSLTF